jgi:hypothetical protein
MQEIIADNGTRQNRTWVGYMPKDPRFLKNTHVQK